MLVDALLDLSEGATKDLPEQAKVLLYAGDGTEENNFGLAEALEAISKCRLIREGHVFETEIHHSLNAFIGTFGYRYKMKADGEIEDVV